MLAEDDTSEKYARCIIKSKRVSWDIDKDVIRAREFDFSQKFLPDSMSMVGRLDFLSPQERRFISQVQGRTYANMFGLVERFINARILESSRDHWLGDQVALEALIRFSDEELKHQELFRRIDSLIKIGMPAGYHFAADENAVATEILKKSPWSVLALICHIEVFTQAHYRQSIEPESNLSPLFKDVFRYHWREEAQHVAIDELEWLREHNKLCRSDRDKAVDDLIDLIDMVDTLIGRQATFDASYFIANRTGDTCETQALAISAAIRAAYRWQYIFSGVEHPRFAKLLRSLISTEQESRLEKVVNAMK